MHFDLNSGIRCPVDSDVIDTYISILRPAYQCSLAFQSENSTIGEVMPCIKTLIDTWNKLDVKGMAKQFCNILVRCAEKKFEFELNSPIYKV